MNKTILLLSVVLSISTVFAQAPESPMTCMIGVISNIGTLMNDPLGLLLKIQECTGNDTWNYLAPFLGGLVRPVAHSAWSGFAVDANGDKAKTELELYNIIMGMVKSTIGEVLGWTGAAFAYVPSRATGLA